MNLESLIEDSLRLKSIILKEIHKNKNQANRNEKACQAAHKRLTFMLNIINQEISERQQRIFEERLLGKKTVFKTYFCPYTQSEKLGVRKIPDYLQDNISINSSKSNSKFNDNLIKFVS